MEQMFWIYPNELAGRPGPGVSPWDLGQLKAGGVDLVVSLATDLFPHSEAVNCGIRRVCVPFPDVLPPDQTTIDLCRAGLSTTFSLLVSSIDAGETAMVHCAAGYDRTGLVLARYIAFREGVSAQQAIAHLRQIRPYALSAEGWEAMAVTLISEALDQDRDTLHS